MKIEFGSIKKKLIKLAISLVALLVLLTLSSITNLSLSFREFMGEVKLSIGQLFSLAIMVIAVLTAKQIVALILGVCNFESHRAKPWSPSCRACCSMWLGW